MLLLDFKAIPDSNLYYQYYFSKVIGFFHFYIDLPFCNKIYCLNFNSFVHNIVLNSYLRHHNSDSNDSNYSLSSDMIFLVNI